MYPSYDHIIKPFETINGSQLPTKGCPNSLSWPSSPLLPQFYLLIYFYTSFAPAQLYFQYPISSGCPPAQIHGSEQSFLAPFSPMN